MADKKPARGKVSRRRLMGQFMAEYRCGCTDVQDRRDQLLEYCGKHGENRRRIYSLPPGKSIDTGLEG